MEPDWAVPQSNTAFAKVTGLLQEVETQLPDTVYCPLRHDAVGVPL